MTIRVSQKSTGINLIAQSKKTRIRTGTVALSPPAGLSHYHYVAFASDASGTGFSLIATNNLQYRAEITSPVAITTLSASDFVNRWVKYIGDNTPATTPIDFGASDVINVDYMIAKGTDLVTNGNGNLGNNYNMPPSFVFDPTISPNLPASFRYDGYYGAVPTTTEYIPIDPSKVYKLRSYLHQEGYNHSQYMGLLLLDVDGNTINASSHMRYYDNGIDSLTTLAAPLSVGDTTITVANAQGWNDSSTHDYHRGVTIFEYKNSFGFKYENYSKIYQGDLFEVGGVNKSTNVITLNKGFPSSLANPDDLSGTWPIGTKIANSSNGGSYKYSFFSGVRVPTLGDWYKTESYMGGVDKSGTNKWYNFPDGTAFGKIFWLPNYSNRIGGWVGHPDSGTNAPVRFSGISVTEANAITIKASDGSSDLFVSRMNGSGMLETVSPSFSLVELVS